MTEPATTATPISLTDVTRAVAVALVAIDYDPANYDIDAIAAELLDRFGDRTLEPFYVGRSPFSEVVARHVR